ncbi:AGAP013143-PA-like protein [Anopheles sinensis]|uniref:AGAP013143-PA-like protein n=1 Tax=Anopheles sinensis TaxID=74873 RepID=A0A084VJH4_ANOSI|nr:AGAP013143-PA-like protein [Anopheles sinensis]
MSSKKASPAVVEADASLGMLEREYLRESLSYVLGIQEVQERIKFEFVEIILRFLSDWLVFYHLGHEVAEDAKEYLSDLQLKVQKVNICVSYKGQILFYAFFFLQTRENFDETRQKAQELKNKYMDSKMKPDSEYTKQGYLYLMEKKFAVVTWSKYYCTYKKQSREFSMVQYNQMSGRSQQTTPEVFTLVSCTRRLSEFEKRYCFDLMFNERATMIYTFQALSEEDIKAWLDAMDGKEPAHLTLSTKYNEDSTLDEVGFSFVRKCIEVLEKRGLEEEGLYRIGGVSTKIAKLLQMGLDRKKTEKERLSFFNDDQSGPNTEILESKTIASALKQYLRHLNEPLMTFRLHHAFIAAAIVFGPTILRAAEETVAAILDIKFNNVVIEILIENYDKIFKSIPPTVQPGGTGDYVTHSITNASFQGPRSDGSGIPGSLAIGHTSTMASGGYSKDSTSSSAHPIYAQAQPVVRVVAKSNYTESVMSSSLQNISNGLAQLYSKGTNHYPTYEAKPTIISSSNINPGSSAAMVRDQAILSQLKSNTSSPPKHHHAPHHQQPLMINSSAYHNTTKGSSPSNVLNYKHHQQPASSKSVGSSVSGSNQMSPNYDRALHHHYKVRNNGGSGTVGIDGIGSSVYGRASVLASSDSNLTSSRKELSLYERINSTSSSNESVCSSSGGGATGISATVFQPNHGSWTGNDFNSIIISNNNPSTFSPMNAPGNSSSSVGLVTSLGGGGASDDSASQSCYKPKKSQRIKETSRGYQTQHAQHLMPTQPFVQQKADKQTFPARENLRVRTLYACLAENDGELSFEPNQIITNVRRSNEPGWLEGTLNGKSGLIPENYVEILK